MQISQKKSFKKLKKPQKMQISQKKLQKAQKMQISRKKAQKNSKNANFPKKSSKNATFGYFLKIFEILANFPIFWLFSRNFGQIFAKFPKFLAIFRQNFKIFHQKNQEKTKNCKLGNFLAIFGKNAKNMAIFSTNLKKNFWG